MNLCTQHQKSIILGCFAGLATLCLSHLTQAQDPVSEPKDPQFHYQEAARWQEIGGDYQKFDQPCDVAVDHRGHIYVADCTLRVVFKFNQSGDLLSVWTGSPEVRFAHPASITIDVGDVYVVDRYASRVFRFDLDGQFKDLWQLSGSDTGDLSEALGICHDPLGALYIADHNRDRINRYNANGQYVGHFGDKAEGKSKLFGPTDLICDDEGNVLTISFNDHLVKFASDGSVLGTWGQKGAEAGQFDDARGLAIDVRGNVYVADTENSRIQRLDKKFLVPPSSDNSKAKQPDLKNAANDAIVVWGQDPSSGTVLKKPTGIAVLGDGTVIVSDVQDGSITLWKPTILENPPPAAPIPPLSAPSPAPNPD